MSITNKYPTGDLELGIHETGATIAADTYTWVFFLTGNFPISVDWEPNIKITITIADNDSYSDAEIYESGYISSGSEAGPFEHAFDVLDTHYIKMETEDARGGTNDLEEYTITVVKTLYFLEEPTVKTQAPLCNKITVRVKDSDPVVEASAETDPAPSSDELIERLVYIDDGDSSVCQAVADELLDKWSQEQKSISGYVNLVVMTKFKEKINIKYPQANIDEEMVLQSKEHNIKKQKTKITCGDILLDDNELLARILDEINGG